MAVRWEGGGDGPGGVVPPLFGGKLRVKGHNFCFVYIDFDSTFFTPYLAPVDHGLKFGWGLADEY